MQTFSLFSFGGGENQQRELFVYELVTEQFTTVQIKKDKETIAHFFSKDCP